MRTASPVLCEDGAHNETLAIQMQAVECAIQTMHTHMNELLTLEDLASVACLSPSHFHRVFRYLIGIPPGEFLSALRFQEARSLLVTTSFSVTDICFEVGYTSIGSFTTRFTQLVGLSPRMLRQRAHAFEPPETEPSELCSMTLPGIPRKHDLLGRISAPATFRGTIYVGLFPTPIPQGAPVCCTALSLPGWYLFHDVPDGIYYLRAAAFPIATDLQSSLLPGEKQLLGSNAGSLVMRQGQVSGDPDLALRPPRLTDPPLVLGLPLL